MYLLLG